MWTKSRRIQLLSILVVVTFTGVGSGRPTSKLYSKEQEYSHNDDDEDIFYPDEPSSASLQYEDYSDASANKVKEWSRDKVLESQDSDYEDYSFYEESRKVDKLLKEDGDRWPTFEEIEKLAGISEWKRERWKQLIKSSEARTTEKPKRKFKFIYRRIQTTGKRNAIIAVSAVSTDQRKA